MVNSFHVVTEEKSSGWLRGIFGAGHGQGQGGNEQDGELQSATRNTARSEMPPPKGPGRIKKYYDVLIHYHCSNSLFVEISSEFSAGNKVFQRPAVFLLPSHFLPPPE